MSNGRGWFERLGRLLFRWRALLGFVAFWLAFWFGDGGPWHCLVGFPMLAAGLAIRYWAMGYIGPAARGREVEGTRYVGAGPYRFFRLGSRAPAGHPLYAGNFLLVLGVLVALWPPAWLGLPILAFFCIEYWLIAKTEQQEMIRRFGPHADRTLEFSLHNGLHEWTTWLVTGFAWGLCWVRAALNQVRG